MNQCVKYGKMGNIDLSGLYGKISKENSQAMNAWLDIAGNPIRDINNDKIYLKAENKQ